MSIEFFSAVILVSKEPSALARFYRDVIGIALKEERHGDTEPHYGCQLGDLHFAIHPLENFKNSGCGVGSVKLAFTVFDMAAFVDQMHAQNVKLLYEPRDTGFAKMTAVHDPDGNLIEFTQLSDGWFKYLEDRKSKGHDVVKRYYEQTKNS
jgi:catechol 2,3-dioxygenase-like lactoylglutathione lyase family enzyme